MEKGLLLGLCLGSPIAIIVCVCGLCIVCYKIEKRNRPAAVVPVATGEQRKEPEEDPIEPVAEA